MTPRPSLLVQQEEATVSICAALESIDRAQISMACGTGKSYVALATAERIHAGLSIILVPTISLSRQLARSARRYGYHRRILTVCTGRERDPGFPATTDAAEIGQFLNDSVSGTTLLVGTYASVPAIGRALRDLDMVADLLVFDEAHRAVGELRRTWSRALNDRGLPARKRLFMTATQRFVISRALDQYVASMDDERVFGPLVYDLPFGLAVERGMIAEVDLAIVVSRGASERSITPLRTLETVRRQFGIEKVITFHGRIREAEKFAEALQKSGEPAFHVSSRSIDSKGVLEAFAKAPRGVVTNARMLTEGIDVPDVDGVMICTPKRSRVDIAQCVGRVARLSPGKTKGWVIVPLVVPPGIEASEALNGTKFGELWSQLISLAGLRAQVRSKPEFALGMRLPAEIKVIVADEAEPEVEDVRLAVVGELEARAAGLRSMVWAATASRCLSLVNSRSALGQTLHGWLNSNRQGRDEGRLTPEQAGWIGRIDAALAERQSARQNKTRARAEAYLQLVRDGRTPYSDKATARLIRGGFAGEDLRQELERLVVERRSKRQERAETYIVRIEAGSPLSCDVGAARGIDEGYYGLDLAERLNAERARRDGTSQDIVEDFLSYFEENDTIICNGKKHPGYVRIHSGKFIGTEHWRKWIKLRDAVEERKISDLEEFVSQYERDGSVADRKIYSRIVNYPGAYPEFSRRLRAAQARFGRIKI